MAKKATVPIFKNKLAVFVGGGFVLVTLIFGVIKFQETRKLITNPALAAEKDLIKTLKKVGKLIELPKDETPTMATVSDKSKLQDELFFKNAENGDKVLIYANAKKAILYRPSTNKIIEVAPVNAGGVSSSDSATQSAAAVSPTIAAKVKVTVYNGTSETGLASKTQSQLESKYTQVEVIGTGNSSENYSKTLVIDLTGKNKSFASDLAKFLGGEVGKLPAGEKKPTADLLVIVGK